MSLIDYIEDDQTYQFTKYLNLAKTEQEKQLFDRFAYGVCDPSIKYPNEKQKKKMIILTILQLCQRNKCVTFDNIQQACFLNSRAEIEQLLIDLIQKELILGTIDDQKGCLNIQRCISRDVRNSDIPAMKKQIESMYERVKHLKQQLKQQ
ncbi:unnamed protein product (macronuclear) [Paramecium tetraurelia]|uniref:PCI domain-containing protein n=1 Tax=Paramecium tetraurelia TaxID=5888 RepID=A0D4U1_PARTE|nr:uncharacterized protein GSPATT00013505001 [Paramecium tetraurelia]CAK78058.1 unnamed protein product [Paramecium tetraurelia]|eukprot:XP_001445455.1 hypothetical protein (macronuclear) [Paramecium tetraurelia strain d4-2]